jgi:hypothetical protein
LRAWNRDGGDTFLTQKRRETERTAANPQPSAFAAIPAELGHLGLVPVEEAGVVTFWQAPEVAFTAADGDYHVVHPARLIADLRRLGGRGMDAAEHVRGELFDVA